jgi:hypothetical protein
MSTKGVIGAFAFTEVEQGESFDVFKKAPGGSMAWVFAVTSLQEARLRLRELSRNDPAEYYVCDLAEPRVVAVMTPDRPELHTLEIELDPRYASETDGGETLRALVCAVSGCGSLD